MTKTLTTLAIYAALSAPALAQVATQDAGKTEAGSYTIEPEHSRIMFSVSHMGFTSYEGEFRNASGMLTLDPKKPDASVVEVKVPTGSVIVPNAKLKEELDGDQWLDAGKYPDISFKSTKVVKTGAATADVTGDFTLHGVTKPLLLKVKFNGAGTNPLDKAYTTGFAANGTIKRSDFGIRTYVPLIGDAVDITISAAFEKGK